MSVVSGRVGRRPANVPGRRLSSDRGQLGEPLPGAVGVVPYANQAGMRVRLPGVRQPAQPVPVSFGIGRGQHGDRHVPRAVQHRRGQQHGPGQARVCMPHGP